MKIKLSQPHEAANGSVLRRWLKVPSESGGTVPSLHICNKVSLVNATEIVSPDLTANMHQIQFWLWSRLKPHLGSSWR